MTPYVVLAPGTLDDATSGTEVVLDDDAHHHLARVLRRRDGSTLVATDGSGREAEARLSGRVLQVEAVRHAGPPGPRIEVAQALGRGRKHDDVVRMLTELGVDRVTAVTTRRTQVDLSGKAERVRARWRSVADAACTQARRPWRPELDGPVPLVDVVAAAAGSDDTALLVADVGSGQDPLGALGAVGVDGAPARVVVVVGPEGGLDDDEVDEVVAAGGRRVSLGPTVLRTEHAALALAAVVAAGTGRMR